MKILVPLRHREFRILWTGMAISLVGDGVTLVAIAWQVYELSDGNPLFVEELVLAQRTRGEYLTGYAPSPSGRLA